MNTVKQTITEQSTTPFARSEQWVDFIAAAVSTKEMDTLISGGSILYAVYRLHEVSCAQLTLTQALVIVRARQAHLAEQANQGDKMTQKITNLDEAMESIQVIEDILNDRPNIRWLVEWQSPEGLVTSLRRVIKTCEEVVTRLKQLLVWAMTRTEGVE